MIEAHTLLGDEPDLWRKDALADIAQLPVTLHTLSAITGQSVKARIEGLKACEGEYITWFDPDDRYPTEAATAFIHEATEAMQRNPQLACVYSYEQRVDEALNAIGRVDDKPYSKSMVITHPAWVHGLIILRRAVVLQHIQNLNITRPYADWQMCKSIASAGHGFIRLPHVARLWRQHPDQCHRIRN